MNVFLTYHYSQRSVRRAIYSNYVSCCRPISMGILYHCASGRFFLISAQMSPNYEFALSVNYTYKEKEKPKLHILQCNWSNSPSSVKVTLVLLHYNTLPNQSNIQPKLITTYSLLFSRVSGRLLVPFWHTTYQRSKSRISFFFLRKYSIFKFRIAWFILQFLINFNLFFTIVISITRAPTENSDVAEWATLAH